MEKENVENLKKFYTNLQSGIKSFYEEIANAQILRILNDENKLSDKFSIDKSYLDEILQKLENLRQETNHILSHLCIEGVNSRTEDNNG